MTEVKLDDPTVTVLQRDPNTQAPVSARIDVTGKLSLAKGDTFESFKVEYTSPTSKNITPAIAQFKAPAPDTTENFKFTHTTNDVADRGTTAGKWKIKATYEFKTGMTPGILVAEKSIEVK